MTHPLEQWRMEELRRRDTPLPAYALAAELKCSPARYSQIINGDAPSPDLAMRIKDLCGISLDVLYGASQPAGAAQ